MIEGFDLPAGWTWSRLGEFAAYITSGSRDWSRYYASSGALFVRTEDINKNRLDLSAAARVRLPSKVEGKRTLLRPWDLLITITGANVGRCAIVPTDIPEAYVSQSLALTRLVDPDLAAFVQLATQAVFRAQKTELEHMAYGIGRPVLNLNNIRDLRVPLAPKSEQRKIVTSVDSYSVRIDEAATLLERTQRNLKRYRASVLKAAVEGRLVPTEAEIARTEKREYEPASELLERVLVERRQQWEKEGRRGKYEEPEPPDTSKLPELPAGWCWAAVEQLGDTVTGNTPSTSHPEFYGGDLPFVKPTDLDVGVVTTAREFLSVSGAGEARVLAAGSILVTCIGATIGKTGVARVACATNQQINALVPAPSLRGVDYLRWFFVGPVAQRAIRETASATTLPILNKSRFERLVVPLPPFEEQLRIVAEVERALSVQEALSVQARAQQARVVRLRQSILKWAFEGKLVDQDPNDEPASALLARIKGETPATPPKKPAAPRRAKKNA